jgi:hypothetical protein
VELLHTDFMFNDGNTLFAGFLGRSERGDRPAELQQRFGRHRQVEQPWGLAEPGRSGIDLE